MWYVHLLKSSCLFSLYFSLNLWSLVTSISFIPWLFMSCRERWTMNINVCVCISVPKEKQNSIITMSVHMCWKRQNKIIMNVCLYVPKEKRKKWHVCSYLQKENQDNLIIYVCSNVQKKKQNKIIMYVCLYVSKEQQNNTCCTSSVASWGWPLRSTLSGHTIYNLSTPDCYQSIWRSGVKKN